MDFDSCLSRFVLFHDLVYIICLFMRCEARHGQWQFPTISVATAIKPKEEAGHSMACPRCEKQVSKT